MTVQISPIYLSDGASSAAVAAELRDAIEDAQLVDWQLRWQPALMDILVELHKRGVPRDKWPQSSHWNWASKIAQVKGLLAFRGFCILCQGETQGLMRVDLNKFAQLPAQKGKPLVYVDYLEAAPWNRPDIGQAVRFKGVGTALITAAVLLSLEEDFKGRIGLHSLPQADGYYQNRCGMSNLGPDPSCQSLTYFEMTPEQAEAFLK